MFFLSVSGRLDTMPQGIRINKYISDAGVCSRREADALIKKGKVTIDGRQAVCGDQVLTGSVVRLDGKELSGRREKVYLAYNKPKGVVCTSDKREKNNIIEVLHYPISVTYAGRLDKNSEGLLLLTNDGELIDRLMRSRNAHEKEYLVTVDRKMTKDFLKALRSGVYLEELGVTTRPCKVRGLSDRSFEIVLTQGLNRQIRRMCEVYGYQVRKLIRVRVANIELGNLKTGQLRELTGEELKRLKEIIREDGYGKDGEDTRADGAFKQGVEGLLPGEH